MSRMIRVAARLVVFTASAATLAGCWPARFVDRPGIVGAVVSAADGKPVAGASVRLVPAAGAADPHFEVVTRSNGTFEFEPIHSWGPYSPLGEGWPITGVVEVDVAGFEPARLDVSWPQTGPAKQSVGVIELTPSSPSR